MEVADVAHQSRGIGVHAESAPEAHGVKPAIGQGARLASGGGGRVDFKKKAWPHRSHRNTHFELREMKEKGKNAKRLTCERFDRDCVIFCLTCSEDPMPPVAIVTTLSGIMRRTASA